MADRDESLTNALRADLTRMIESGETDENKLSEYVKGFKEGSGTGNFAKSMDALMEGATAGWSDELERGARGIFSRKSDPYNAGLIARRRAEFGEDSPKTKFTLNVAGAFVPAAVAMAVPGARPMAARTAGNLAARAGVGGAVGGAVAGVGDAPYGSTLGQMFEKGAMSGAVGGAGGAALAGIAYPAARALMRVIGNRRGTAGAGRRAMESAASADGTTLEDIAKKTLADNTDGSGAVPTLLPQSGGIGTRAVLEDVAGHPGSGARKVQATLEGHGLSGGERLTSAITKASDPHITRTPRDYAAAARGAKPIYDSFQGKPVNPSVMTEVKNLLKTQDGQEAYWNANRILDNDPNAAKLPSVKNLKNGRANLTFDQVDKILSQLRNKARQFSDSPVPGGKPPNPALGRSIRERANRITAELDSIDPNYALARRRISQWKEVKEASKIGKNIMNMDDETFQDLWTNAPPEVQQGLRIGFRNFLIGKGRSARGTAHQDISRRMPPGEQFEKRFSTLFPGGDQQFYSLLRRERDTADLAVQGLKNVRTAGRTEAGRYADRASSFRAGDVTETISEASRRKLNASTANLAVMHEPAELEALIRKMQLHARARQRGPGATGVAVGIMGADGDDTRKPRDLIDKILGIPQ